MDGKPIRILLAESNPEDRELLRRELESAGILHDCRSAESEDAFVRELSEFNPDLIISDYQLNDVEGLVLLARTRQTHKNTPFIFVSWIVHEATVIEAVRQGATDYVFKDQLSRLPFCVMRALREAEEKADLENTQARMAQQERLNAFGQMASGIAHDFSNALMPVLGYSELLLNQPENISNDDKLRYYLKMMNMAAKDAVNIVSRLQDFYRKRSEQESFAPVDLNQIVEFTILFTRPKWKDQALSRGAVIKVETELERLPKVFGNDTSLREVLTNLIFNAVDAMPKGGAITMTARIEGSFVALDVADTGAGMDEETLKKCFEPFYSTKGKRGTGLGLAMAKAIVEKHGGSIEVRSQKGRGTTFCLHLPVYEPALHGGGEAADVFLAAPEQKLNVLVLDDDPATAEVIGEYLKNDGHEVRFAATLREVMDKFKGERLDLIVTDWILQQGIGGHSLIAQIKQLYPKVPLIMMTGFAELAQIRFQKNEAGITLLRKPPTLLAVREAVLKSLPKAA